MQSLILVIEDDLARAEQEFAGALRDVSEALPDTTAGQRLRAYVLGNAVADTYEGLEVIFRRIAADIDDSVPRGDDWHRALLLQMAASSEKRAPVIAEDTAKALNILRAFRHVVRHRYLGDLEAAFVHLNVERMRAALPAVRRDLDAFMIFLREEWLRR